MAIWRVFWGLVLVVLGGLFLADNLGLVSFDFGLLWPAFLILLGITFLLGGRWVGSAARDEDYEHYALDLDEATEASVSVEHGAGRLAISGPAEADQLLEGEFYGASIRKETQGERANVQLEGWSSSIQFMPWNWGRPAMDWNFRLSGEIPLSIHIQSGANSNELDLRKLKVRELKLETGASSTELWLPEEAGFTHVDIDSGASSIEINVPEGVAADIRIDSGLADISVDRARFPRSNGHYTSPDYDDAANRIEMDIDTGVSSVTIK